MAGRRTLGVIAGAYVSVRLLLLWSMGAPGDHADTESYRSGVSFVGGAPRTWPFPLTLEVFGELGVTIVQTVVSAAAFCVLAWALAGQMRDRRVGWAIGGFVLLLGLAPRVTTWDQMLLTESLAISLTALLIASLVQLDGLPWWVVAGVFTLWVFVRDGHLYLGVLVVAGVCWWAWQRRTFALPAALIAVLVWCGVAAQNDRYVEGFNVAANLGGRVAYDDVDTWRWFGERGMPASDGWYVFDSQVERIRALYSTVEFREWADGEGVGVYTDYLLSNPGFVALGVLHLFYDDPGEQMGVAESLSDHSWVQSFENGYPVGPAFVWPSEGDLYSLSLVIGALVGVLLVSRSGRLDRRWRLPGFLLASTPLHALLAWHATPFEIARHGVVLSFVLVVTSWWMIALAVDAQTSGVSQEISTYPSPEFAPSSITNSNAPADGSM